MQRALEPEWLDELPATNPRSLASRNDLRRVNTMMGNSLGVMRGLLQCFPDRPPRSLVDLGSGDGHFALRLSRMLGKRWPGVRIVLLDRNSSGLPAIRDQIVECGWTVELATSDVFDWIVKNAPFDAAVANLFLHHFDTERLARLFALLASKTSAVVACEPRRAWLPLLFSRLLFMTGCNDVTRHDAPVSVRAGFRGRELTALWPRDGWSASERRSGLFSHVFQARRKL